uniref:SFRICE_039817 n=1 Tax=Spodoptera frugiperda TaxID=7108 RepID=A0A2H1WNQ0_SPOFR
MQNTTAQRSSLGESSSEPGRLEKFSIGMSGIITKLSSKASQPQPLPLDNNPILQYFEVGAESSTAGPGLIWRIHDAYRKSDGKVSEES